MSFETDDRQLRMDAQDNTETITYPQTENEDGAEINTDGPFIERKPENIKKSGEKGEHGRNTAGSAQGGQPGASQDDTPLQKNAHKDSAAYPELRPVKKRRKAFGSKSSFGAPLNASASVGPRRRERLEEIEEPAKVLRADDGFTGKFTWPEKSASQNAASAPVEKPPVKNIANSQDTDEQTAESSAKALSTRATAEQANKNASDINSPAERTVKSTPDTRRTLEQTVKNASNVQSSVLREVKKDLNAAETHFIQKEASTGSRADQFDSSETVKESPGSAAKYQSGIGDGVKDIINRNAPDGLVDDIEDITAEDSLTLSLPKISIEHTQINNRHAFRKTNIQPDDISADEGREREPYKKNAAKGQAPSKVLTALIEKPQILLETPYSVLTKNGPHLRYRLEYGYPDAKIPEQEQSIPGQDFSPLELEAMNRSAPVAEGKKTRSHKKHKSLGKEIFGWLKVLAAALILALVIRQFVFVLVWVEGSSMEPTLMNQERIIVTRYDYIFGDPQRQDIVICHFPDGEDRDNYVKRVIGLPGERISIDDGVVYINGEALEEPYVVYEKIQDMDEITIPEDMYFVMGDNRFNSRDSRVVGLIERSQIQGHVRYVFYPFEDRRSVDYS